MNTYSYKIGNNLYINLTNKCSNDCTFCVRNEKASYYGNYLWLDKEPTPEEVISSIPEKISSYDEIVFCGFGEPTCRFSDMIKTAELLKSNGAKKIRLNTNGHANLIQGYNVIPQMKGRIDEVNISMNSPTKEGYNKLCRPANTDKAFEAMLEFGEICRDESINAHFSVVDCIGKEQVALCQALADKIGLPLRVREFIADS